MEEVSTCPLCSAADQRPFDQRTFRDQLVENQVCVHCGFVYQSPRMTAQELDRFYEAEYRTLYQGTEGPGRKDLVVQAGRAESLLVFLRQAQIEPARILDIGCSAGTFLLRLKAQYGADVMGIEPGAAYRDYANSQGLQVYASLEEMRSADEERFDLISMAHVLEHLPNPVGYLAELRQTLLTPEGTLLVEVPNLYTHDSFEVAHLTAFSRHTLSQTLQKAGYEILVLSAHGQPRSVVLPLYLTAVARSSAGPDASPSFKVIPEQRVALKRRWGLRRRKLLERLVPDLAWLAIP